MSRRQRSARAFVRSCLLSVGAALGVVCILATAAGALLGVRPLVVESGSMAPAIPTGSLVLVHDVPASSAGTGQVVAVERPDGNRVLHRVVSTVTVGDRVALTLKGDANGVPDADPYLVERVLEVRARVAWLGYPLAWASTTPGLLLLGALTSALLLFAFRRGRPGDGPPAARGGGRKTHRRGSPRRRQRAAATRTVPVAAVAVMAVVAGGAPAWAWFTDTGTVSSAAAGTHRVLSQAQPVCTNVEGLLTLGNIARVTWVQADARYEYRWELRTTGGSVLSSGTLGTGLPAGDIITLDISAGMISANGNYDLVVHARLRSATTWVAATSTTTPVRRGSLLVLGVSIRCGHG